VTTVCSGIARLLGTRGEQPNWPHVTDIMHFKNTPSFIEIPFIWLSNLKNSLAQEINFLFT
jgi:hypothetical protein